MTPRQSMIALGIALAATCGSPGNTHAEQDATADATVSRLGGKVVDTALLARQRGGTETHLSDIHATGSVSEVQAHDLVTGHNTIADGALAGASGMPIFIQNSGNGVLIQNAVILNVELQ